MIMNEAQRKVLRLHHGTILKNLTIDNDLLSLLLQKELLSEAMVHTIQSKATQHEKITELLMILPKRGPKAFAIFLEATKRYSPLLADKLEADLQKEQNQATPVESTTPKAVPEVERINLDESSHNNTPSGLTPRSPDKIFEKRSPIKDLERRHSLSISSSNHAMTSSIIQQNLNMLYTKIKAKQPNTKPRDPTSATPEPATFKMIDKVLDELFKTLDECETTIAQCHALLGGRDRNYPLVSHIINLQRSKRDLEQELKSKDQQKNKYAEHISKLENRCRNQGTEINHLNAEVKRLKEELEKLEAVTGERDEKQKIIDELRKMVMDADVSKKSRLRSGYLALHYDSSSSEIKQLKSELRALKLENENLKTENVMMKKTDSLKKLAKMKDVKDDQAGKTEPGKTETEVKDDTQTQSGTKPSFKQQYMANLQSQMPLRATARSFDKQMFQYQGVQRIFLRASADDIHKDSENDAKGKPIKTKYNDKDKFNEELEFKFSNLDNESLGTKRSSSKERAGKRVTFVSDLGAKEADKASSKLSASVTIAESVGNESFSSVTTSVPSLANGIIKASTAKQPTVTISRKKPSHLRTKSVARRSVSLNSLSTSKDIMKMSTQLIQKSRSLRQNTTANY